MCESIPTIVVDNGSSTIKAGIAGNDAPSAVFSSAVGYAKHRKHSALYSDLNQNDRYVGDELSAMSGVVTMNYPIKRGIVTNWDDMEKIWKYIFYSELKVDPSENRVLYTESPFNPIQNRERMVFLLFDTFSVPAIYSSLPGVLSLFSTKRVTGVTVDSGYGVTQIVPTYEGFSIHNATKKLDIAGCDLTDYMQDLLKQRNIFFESSDMKTVNYIKEKCCNIALDFETEMKVREKSKGIKTYDLPNGKDITIENEDISCPEILFNPALVHSECDGIHKSLFDSIMTCNEEIRKDLFDNIVLSGGTTNITGFKARLEKEMTALTPNNTKIEKIPEEYSSWVGGSMLASLDTFSEIVVTKEEYDEYGAIIFHKKCFL